MNGLQLFVLSVLAPLRMVAGKYDAVDELQVVFSQFFQSFWPVILIILIGVIAIGLVPGARRWLGTVFRG